MNYLIKVFAIIFLFITDKILWEFLFYFILYLKYYSFIQNFLFFISLSQIFIIF
jgi:hypothetical protein